MHLQKFAMNKLLAPKNLRLYLCLVSASAAMTWLVACADIDESVGECQSQAETGDTGESVCEEPPPPPSSLCALDRDPTPQDPPPPDDAVVFEVGGVARAKMGVRGCDVSADFSCPLEESVIATDSTPDKNKLDVIFEIGPEPEPPAQSFEYPRPYNVGACCTPNEQAYEDQMPPADMIAVISDVARRDCGASVCLQIYEEFLYQSENYDGEGPASIDQNTRNSFEYFAEQLENPDFFEGCRAKVLEQVLDDEMNPMGFLSTAEIDAWSGFEDDTIQDQFVINFEGDEANGVGSIKEAYLAYACDIEVGPEIPEGGAEACAENPNYDEDNYPVPMQGSRGNGVISGGVTVVLPNSASVAITGTSFKLRAYECGLLTCPVTLSELDLRAPSLQVGPLKLFSIRAELVGLALGRRDGDVLTFESGSVALDITLEEVKIGPMALLGDEPVTVTVHNDGPMIATVSDDAFVIDVLEFLMKGLGPNVDRVVVSTEPASVTWAE